MRYVFLVIALASHSYPATVDFLKSFQGNGKTVINAVASDSEGNAYLAGTTTSFDLPVRNAFQPRNPGAPIVVSNDGGATWVPIGHVPESGVIAPVKLPSPQTALLTLGVNGIYRSTDEGDRWKLVFDVAANRQRAGYVSVIDYDRRNPSVVYASASGGVLKSTDGGSSWTLMNAGLPAGGCCLGSIVSVDPFRPGSLYFSLEGRAYVSNDSAASWKQIAIPAGLRNPRIIASPWTAGAAFLYSYESAYRTSDGGLTWTALTTIPTSRLLFEIVLHPTRAGRLYARTWESLFRSDDGGLTWTPLSVPGVDPSLGGTGIFFQPGAADTVFISSGQILLHSVDAGVNWQPWKIQRPIYGLTFDPSNPARIYAAGPITEDAFIAKLTPEGEVSFLTYLGGQGFDSAVSLAVDQSGSVYLGGLSQSIDFPGAGLRSYRGPIPSAFVAKLSSSGDLAYSVLLAEPLTAVAIDPEARLYFATRAGVSRISADSSAIEISTALRVGASSIAVDAMGNVVVASGISIMKLDPFGRELFSKDLAAIAYVATDGDGNIYATAAVSGSPPVTENASRKTIDTSCPHNSGNPTPSSRTRAAYMTDVYLLKLSPDGSETEFATLFGGNCRDVPTAIAVAPDGSIWVAGRTFSDSLPSADLLGAPPVAESSKAFLAHFDPTGSRLLFSSYAETGSSGIAVGPEGSVYAVENSPLNQYYGYSGPALVSRITPAQNRAPLEIKAVGSAFKTSLAGISPMEMVRVDVPGLMPASELDLQLEGAEDRPRELDGVSVSFNGVAAQLLALHPNEIVCLSPRELSGASAAVVRVKNKEAVSSDFLTAVRKRNFSFFPQIRNADGSIHSSENPAPRGSNVSVFVTGAGWPALAEATLLTPELRPFGTARLEPIAGFVKGFYEIRIQATGAFSFTMTDPISDPIDPWVWNATIPPPISLYVK